MRRVSICLLASLATLPELTAADHKVRAAAVPSLSRRATVGQFDRIIPLVRNGGGFKTSVVVTNLDTKEIFLDVYFIGNNDDLLELPISGVGPASRLVGSLDVNESIVFESDGSGEFQEGAVAIFTVDRAADDPASDVVAATLGGMAFVRGTPPGEAPFEASIPITSGYETRFTLPFDNRSLENVLILLNPTTRPSPVSITARDSEGAILGKESATLASGQRRAIKITELLPDTAAQIGILQVTTSAIGLAGLGLRTDTSGRLTVLHTLSSSSDPDAPKPPPASSGSTLPGIANTCSALEGTLLFANNGQFLGKITSNTFDSDSLGNQFGRYGSAYSPVSIFNQYGTYGGEYSALSPFNSFSSTPPVIYRQDRAVAFLTVNQNKTPGIDPRSIYPCIGRR